MSIGAAERSGVRVAGVSIGNIGFGAFNLSLDPRPSRTRATRTIHAALDAGIRLIDTADAYCRNSSEVGHNERLLRAALRSWRGDRDGVLVVTKGGHVRTAAGEWLVDGTPEHLRRACDASLVALGVDSIGLYLLHRPDPSVPYAESVGALRDLQLAGKVRHVGVSNVGVDEIDIARSLVAVAAVENELSPMFTRSIGEARHCADHDIPFLAWAPLGGRRTAAGISRACPWLCDLGHELAMTPQQAALLWVRAQGRTVVPIPGATRPETIGASVAALAAPLDLVTERLAQ